MASVEVSETEILEALRAARNVDIPDPPGAFLVTEMAKKSGIGTRTLREQIAVLRSRGLVETVQVYRKGSDGRQLKLTAYRILKAKAKR